MKRDIGKSKFRTSLNVVFRVHSLLWNLFLLLNLAFLLGPVAPTAKGQQVDPLEGIGILPFSTKLPVENGYINPATGDLHLEFPLGTFAQRGSVPMKAALVYDSSIWSQRSDSGTWSPTSIPSQYTAYGTWYLSGWRYVTSADEGVPHFNDIIFPYMYCIHNGTEVPKYIYYSNWTWSDSNGATHSFPIRTEQGFWTQYCGDFSTNPSYNVPNGDAVATDSSGYHMYVTGFTSATVYGPDGTKVLGAPKDTNGNYFPDNAFNMTDTLGRIPVTTTISGSTVYFDVLNSTGSTSRYTITLQTINVHSNFDASGSMFGDYSGTITVIESIQQPDGTSYSFQYDSGTAAGHYGEMTSMTLPTGTGAGSTITYAYANFADSEYAVSGKHITREISKRTTPDGAWNYSPTVVTACTTSIAVNCQQKFEVQKPSNDVAYYTFNINGGIYPIEVDYFTGSSTLIATQTQSFDYTHTIHYFWPPYPAGAGYVTQLSATTTLPITSSTNVHQTTQFCYDINYGNLLYKWEWNFYTSAIVSDPHPPGYPCSATATPDRTKTYAYLTAYTGTDIHNRPSSVTVTTGSTTVAQTLYAYDGSTIVSATGKSQHDDTHFPTTYTYRGNLTEVQQLISGTSNYLNTYKTYDMTGQVATSTDSNTNSTSYSYADNFFTDGGDATNPPSSYTPTTSTNAYLNTITHPTVNSVTLIDTFGYYWGAGQKALYTDPNSQTTYFHFSDSLSRPTSMKLPNGEWNYSVYPSASETQVDTGIGITSTTRSITCTGSSGDCRHDQTQLDGLGRLSSRILVSDPDGQTTTVTTYDSNGRAYSVSNPHRSSSLPTDGTEYYFYDGLDRIKQVTRADGGNTYTTYGALIGSNGRSSQLCSGFGVGYPVLYKDEAAKLRQTWTDGFGRLIEVDEPDPSSGSLTSGSPAGTCYSYDLNNNLTGVTQGSQTRSFSYDMLSRLTLARNPESNTVNYYYTTSGGSPCSGDMSAVCRRTDARSKTTTYIYDALNRLTTKSYSDGTLTAYYYYDQSAPFGYPLSNYKGRMTSMGTNTGTSWVALSCLDYDTLGNVSHKRDQVVVGSNVITEDFYYTYNLDGSIASIKYPSGRTVTYQPGGAQRPLSEKDVANSVNYATGAHYFPPGELGSLTNGSSINFTGITNNRLQPCWIYATTGTALSWSNTSCTTSETTAGNILDLEYGFNFGSSDNGNVMGITNNRNNTRSQAFIYDYRNRITMAETTSTYATSTANCWSELYHIDTLGNLLSIAPPSGTYPTNPYGGCVQESGFTTTVNSQNQNASSCYDASGNNVGAAAASPPYCSPLPTTYSYNAENQLTSTGGVTYSYDGDGKRVEKNNGTLYWYGTSPDPLLETNGSGALTYEYIFFGGKRTARRDSSGNIDYYFSDQLGTSRVVTNASGTIQDDSDFYPYGGERPVTGPSSGNHYKFAGKERDSESGLDNFGARYDSSQYGRFMTPDPGNASGLSHMDDPQSWNGYAYARNNPLSYTDPSGLNYTVCQYDSDGNKTNCADLTNDQYKQYQQQNSNVHSTASGDLYLTNENGSETKIGNASYYNEKDVAAASQITQYGPPLEFLGGLEASFIMPGMAALEGTLPEAGLVGGLGLGAAARGEGQTTPAAESTGRTVPVNLKEQLAMQQAKSNPAAGQQVPLKMNDPRWPDSQGWVKMRQNVNGVEVHYNLNTKTGEVADFKFK